MRFEFNAPLGANVTDDVTAEPSGASRDLQSQVLEPLRLAWSSRLSAEA